MQLPAWLLIFFFVGGIFWICAGAYSVLDQKDGIGYSLSFSAGATYWIFMSAWGLIADGYIPIGNTILGLFQDNITALSLAGGLAFFVLWLFCEVLLRKIVWYRNPQVAF